MAEVRIKIRNDLASQWVLANPVLSRGEPGFEHDTGKLKVGDGVTSWISLPYWIDELTTVSVSSIVYVQSSPPSSPADGWLWLNNTTGELSIYTLGAWENMVSKQELASDTGALDINAGYF